MMITKERLAILAAYTHSVVRDGFATDEFEFAAMPDKAADLMRELRTDLAHIKSESHVKSMFGHITITAPDDAARAMLDRLVCVLYQREGSWPELYEQCGHLVREIEYDGHADSNFSFIAMDNRASQLVTILRKALHTVGSESLVQQSFGKVQIREPDKAARKILAAFVESLMLHER